MVWGKSDIRSSVMPGLVPGTHVFRYANHQVVDGRDKPGHDEFEKVIPAAKTTLIVFASLTGDAALLEALLAVTVRAADNAARYCRPQATYTCLRGGAPGGASSGTPSVRTRTGPRRARSSDGTRNPVLSARGYGQGRDSHS